MNRENNNKKEHQINHVSAGGGNACVDENESSAVKIYYETSIWSSLWYGLGMLAFILMPFLIPGVTLKMTIIVVVLLVIAIYVYAAVIHIVRARRSHKPMKSHKHGKLNKFR